MFNIGAGEMIVIALILLMAVGPEQLPGLIRRVGRTVSEVKGMTEGLRAEFMSGLDEIERATDPEAWAAGNEPSKVKPRTGPVTATPAADAANGTAADQIATENAGSAKNGSVQDAADQNSVDQDSAEEDSADQDSVDQDSVDQESADQGSADQSSADQDSADQDSADQDTAGDESGTGKSTQAVFGDTAPPIAAPDEAGQGADPADNGKPTDPGREAEAEETT